MSIPFFSATALVVTCAGPGNLHLLSYADNSGLASVVGSVATTNAGITRFIISHSYTYTKFAFYFDGSGEAVWSVGSSLERQPVGKSWASAQVVTWGASATTADVTSALAGAVNRDNQITAFIIPDKF